MGVAIRSRTPPAPPLPVPCSLHPLASPPAQSPPSKPAPLHPQLLTSYLEPPQPCQPPRPDPKSSTRTNKTSSTPKIAKNTWHSSFTHTHIIEAGGELPAAPASAQRRKQPAKHMIPETLQLSPMQSILWPESPDQVQTYPKKVQT